MDEMAIRLLDTAIANIRLQVKYREEDILRLQTSLAKMESSNEEDSTYVQRLVDSRAKLLA